MTEPQDLAYPIGRFERPLGFDAKTREAYTCILEEAPRALALAVEGLDEARLDTRYRPGGWTLRQVLHHLPDSHLNAYLRFKLALTEPQPTIRPYDEALWAELPEARTGPVTLSLELLASLHARWVAAIRGLPPEAFERAFLHPDLGLITLDHQLGLYAWHSQHHVAHVSSLRTRMGWQA